MKKVEINRLEAHIDLLCANNEGALKEYTILKLKEAGFDFTKPIDYIDEIHTITYTQED